MLDVQKEGKAMETKLTYKWTDADNSPRITEWQIECRMRGELLALAIYNLRQWLVEQSDGGGEVPPEVADRVIAELNEHIEDRNLGGCAYDIP